MYIFIYEIYTEVFIHEIYIEYYSAIKATNIMTFSAV